MRHTHTGGSSTYKGSTSGEVLPRYWATLLHDTAWYCKVSSLPTPRYRASSRSALDGTWIGSITATLLLAYDTCNLLGSHGPRPRAHLVQIQGPLSPVIYRLP